eukprot:CAMPEP_0201555576 /NCGR_PEP_ID=MMETSP0173_2-20130828/49865_1 /ASSEMBLY_ACC=CAM_ASM_000268 /TAXON_ID=218659 /ORGANISM="Vexillifera sp., Strain DIVA3 564/2" /LENGTH=158 /DNA_ID=CAMNT_0047967433 /DNA_START=1 /DNA_END=477 /DNA_ORIENTATION=+
MVGLDAAGKTTILYKLKIGDVETTIPTIGFCVDTAQYKNVTFISWDIGNEPRWSWKDYFDNVDAIIYVVDSIDHDRFEKTAQELENFLKFDALKDAKLLILANKQDLSNPISLQEMRKKFKLDEISNRQWNIQSTCAISGEGLSEGLDWLSTVITSKK